MKRALTNAERSVVERIAEKLPLDERIQLLDDLAHATAEPVTPDGSRVVFEIRGYNRPPYRGQRSFGVPGKLRDSDGAELAFDLFADESGRLLELEIVRWGEGNVIAPDWESLVLY